MSQTKNGKLIGRPPRPMEDRFFEKVNFKGPIMSHMKTRCYIWTAGTFADGYGMFQVSVGITERANRLAWKLGSGKEIPKGLVVRHKCDNIECVRYHHLELGTVKDNVTDRVNRNRGARGETQHLSKLTESDVKKIRLLLERKTMKHREIAKQFGVSRPTITSINNNKTWMHVKPTGISPAIENSTTPSGGQHR